MPPSPYLPHITSPNVLVFDGGGVRGLSSLIILRKIILRLQVVIGSKYALQPWQLFDLICGTSTGGIIAIMLGRLRMSIDEAIGRYRDFSKTVFSSPIWFRGLRSKVFGTSIYNASILKRYMRRMAAESDATGHNGEALLQEPLAENPQGVFCHTFVVATRKNQATPTLFTSYAQEGTCKIWESARATVATHGFFDPIKLQVGTNAPVKYLDGELVANNPSKLACQQVEELFPGRPIGCFLSLGTGRLEVVKIEGNLVDIGNACQELAKNCEMIADELWGKFWVESKKNGTRSPYFRFSVERGLQKIKFDEWAKESKLVAVTDAYMHFYDQEVAVNRCVNALKRKAEWVMAQEELV